MNYRHLYHAGNFADVLKHVVMIALLRAISRKEEPFCFFDTHAGIGLYPLQSIEAQKSQEYENGIANLLAVSTDKMPDIIREYTDIINQLNPSQLCTYPGSPFIAQQCLRKQDQLILCELHPQDVKTLKANMPRHTKMAIHHMDAYLGMKAFLPPKLKRGLVMIDPPFEVNNEFELILQALQQALKHWQSGHFMIWYPIKNQKAVQIFYLKLRSFKKPVFMIEFQLNHPAAVGKLSQCGIVLINPPWQTKELLVSTLLPYLASVLDASWHIFDF